MVVRPKMGYVQAKIGLTGQFDWCEQGNYLKPWNMLSISFRKHRNEKKEYNLLTLIIKM